MARLASFRFAPLACALALGAFASPVFAADPATSSTAQVVSDVQRQALAKGLYELAYSPRQDAVFVASSGGFGDDAGPAQVLRLDPHTLAVQQAIPLQRKGFGVVLDDAHDRLYVGNTVDTSVTVVDTAANREVGRVQLMDKQVGKDGKATYTHDLRELVVDAPHQRLYVTGHSGEGSVLFVVDTRTLKVIKTIEGLGKAKAPGLVLDAKGKQVFTSNLLGEVVVIDNEALAVSRRMPIGADQPMNLALDADGKRLFATDQGLEMIRNYQAKSIPGFVSKHPGNRVLVLDPATGKQLASLPTGDGPLGLLLDAPRQRLYVTNRQAGTVSAYDSERHTLLNTWTLPTHPNSLTLDAKRNVLYVSIKNGDAAEGDSESVARIALDAPRTTAMD